MQHMIYGSSAIAFSQRYEAAIARSGSKNHASSKPVFPLSPAFSYLACRRASNLVIASKIRLAAPACRILAQPTLCVVQYHPFYDHGDCHWPLSAMQYGLY
jgi:hypothetical protein